MSLKAELDVAGRRVRSVHEHKFRFAMDDEAQLLYWELCCLPPRTQRQMPVVRVTGQGHPISRPLTARHFFYRAIRKQPLNGGFIGVPYYGPDDFFDYPPYAPYAPDTSTGYSSGSPSAQDCLQPTHKTVTVPAEAGGTQQVTITYCHH